MPALSVERLTVLLYVSLAMCALLVLAVLALGLQLARIRRTHARALDGVPHGDLLAAVSKQIESVKGLERTSELLAHETALLRQRFSTAIRTVGFARYDAFPDVGGNLSFSTALLDEAGDGVVLSTINGRTNSRSYAKAIRGGRSEYQLSEDERAAIAMAMGEPDQQQIARSHA